MEIIASTGFYGRFPVSRSPVYSAAQSRKAVPAHLESEQVLPLGFVRQ